MHYNYHRSLIRKIAEMLPVKAAENMMRLVSHQHRFKELFSSFLFQYTYA